MGKCEFFSKLLDNKVWMEMDVFKYIDLIEVFLKTPH
ncbi:hypothetical protein V6Z12_D10G217700 [Gossypium hirsutum]